MTVRQVLATHTSSELTAWMGYEMHNGPLDDTWLAEAVANLHEQFQRLNRLTGAAHFTNRTHTRNPVPKEKRYPRPWELIAYEEDDPEGDEPDGDADESGL